MSSQEESSKLSDDEKFKLIEFYKDSNEVWVTKEQIRRIQRALETEELVVCCVCMKNAARGLSILWVGVQTWCVTSSKP